MNARNDEGPSDCSARAFKEQVQAVSLDSASADADEKEFSRLRAQLAMRGHCAFRTTEPADGRVAYLVTRGGWLRELPDLAALRELVERVGGAR